MILFRLLEFFGFELFLIQSFKIIVYNLITQKRIRKRLFIGFSCSSCYCTKHSFRRLIDKLFGFFRLEKLKFIN